jgi:uncharacterized protein
MKQTDINPWYKEPWPWFILGLLGVGVFAGSTLAFIGISNPPELVRGEYEVFARGLTDTGVRTRQAKLLGLSGSVSIQGEQIVVVLAASQADQLPDSLLVQFQHPAYGDQDSVTRVERSNHGRYVGVFMTRPHARAHIIISDPAQSWWLAGRLDGSLDSPVDVVPRRL